VLQAIAAWGLASIGGRNEANSSVRRGVSESTESHVRHFSGGTARSFDLLWLTRKYTGSIEIALKTDRWAITMEFIGDSTEQIYVAEAGTSIPATARAATLPRSSCRR